MYTYVYTSCTYVAYVLFICVCVFYMCVFYVCSVSNSKLRH